MDNIILMSDSYKYSQSHQYPPNTTFMSSYLESRGGSKTDNLKPYVKFFGLQYYVKKYLSIKITQQMVDEASELLKAHGVPFEYDGWMKIVNQYDGMIPLKIKAVKEGSIMPRRIPLMVIESTDSELFWLVSFFETLLLKVWYPITVATLSYNIKELMLKYNDETSDNKDKVSFMLHDFGYRGASSEESAAIGSLSHLTNFKGTDTIAGIICGQKYYNTKIAGYSIPASEHSTMTMWGEGSVKEKGAFLNMINLFADDYPLYSVVSDSWDFNEALKTWSDLKGEVIKHNGKLVIRPDSGDSKLNIINALKVLEKSYGITINKKGYKVLNSVSLIQGDGVNYDEIYDILSMMKENEYSSDNIVFGMGGALLQGNNQSSINRDAHQFAIKCSAAVVNNQLIDVFKNPVTDSGKVSKKGRLNLVFDELNNKYLVEKLKTYDEEPINNEYVTYYHNGKILVDYSLDDIEQNMSESFRKINL